MQELPGYGGNRVKYVFPFALFADDDHLGENEQENMTRFCV